CPIIGVSGGNSAPSLVSVGGRNRASSLVSVGGGIVPHRWCQWGEESCLIVGVSGGRNRAP
ncbi:unnamed protein product, partial [Staurois parvus]